MQLTQSVSLSQNLVSKIELCQALKIQIQLSLNKTRAEAGIDSADAYDQVVKAIVEDRCPENLKPTLQVILSDPLFKKCALGMKHALVQAREKDARSLSAEYLYASSDGNIAEPGESYKLDKGIFLDALLERHKVDRQIRDYESFRSAQPDSFTEQAAAMLAQYRSAKHFGEMFDETFSAVALGVFAAMRIKGDEGRSILSDFFLDVTVLDRFTLMLPERFVNRFVKRFSVVRDRDSFRTPWVQDAFLNTVGEYTLLTLGIISQDMFTLQRGRVDPEFIAEFKQDGFDMASYLRRLNLKSSGVFFWNRWHTMHRKPTRITDNLIRAFITRTVRKDSATILKAVEFEDLFAKLKAIAREPYVDAEVSQEACSEILIETITDDKFVDLLVSRLKRSWLKELEVFY